jgi:hypothetical protein
MPAAMAGRASGSETRQKHCPGTQAQRARRFDHAAGSLEEGGAHQQ